MYRIASSSPPSSRCEPGIMILSSLEICDTIPRLAAAALPALFQLPLGVVCETEQGDARVSQISMSYAPKLAKPDGSAPGSHQLTEFLRALLLLLLLLLRLWLTLGRSGT